jgi:hypothetical protein
MVAAIIYALCAFMALVCAWLLLAAYARSRYRLLLWGGLCFCGMTASNALLMIDKVMLGPDTDLSLIRHVITGISLLIFLYGLIWDTE